MLAPGLYMWYIRSAVGGYRQSHPEGRPGYSSIITKVTDTALVRMRILLALMAVLSSAVAVENYYRMPAPYSFSCKESKCIRENRMHADHYMSLDACTLSCGKYGSLWPKPSKKVQLSKDLVSFHPENVKFTKVGVTNKIMEKMMDESSHYFMRKLHFKHPEYPQFEKGPFTEYEYHESNFKNQKLTHNTASGPYKNIENEEHVMRYEQISPFSKKRSNTAAQKHHVNIEVTITSDIHELHLDTDESYDIVAQTVGDTTTVTIIANTYYGARHALESLSQMMAYDEMNNSLMMLKSAKISDKPAFEYRGIMLDTGRNYYPKEEIMRLLDTMSSNKLNTFHWHIADSASFPMYSQRQPQLTYLGAYSPSKIYYPKDIREIVEYANQRGIRVVPELSAPAHTGAGWTFGEEHGKGKLVLCNEEDEPWTWYNLCNEPPCGQLNPINPEVFTVLKEVYSDIIDAFDPELFHMGGDDVSFKCWQNSPEVIAYLNENEKGGTSEEMFELWTTFQNSAYSKLFEATERRDKTVKPIIYSSSFALKHLDKSKYIIQLTNAVNDSEIVDFINKGYQVIFSNSDAWNFEGPAHTWVGNKATTYSHVPRPSWKEVYENSPLDMLNGLGVSKARSTDVAKEGEVLPRDMVLGGEATIWSYETDSASLQSTTWPRASAMAERLWSDPQNSGDGTFHAEEAQYRLAAHRHRMVNEGTRAEAIQPEFCFQNQNSCYSQEEYEFLHEQNTEQEINTDVKIAF